MIGHHCGDTLILVGGALPTSIPHDWIGNPGVDIVFVGEADVSLRRLLNGHSLQSIDGIGYNSNGSKYYQTSRLPNADELVYPDYGILHAFFPDESNIQIQVGRGCNYACKICGNRAAMLRTNIRKFDVCMKDVISAGHKNISFVDNDF